MGQVSLDMILCCRVYSSWCFEGQWHLHFRGWVDQEDFFLDVLVLLDLLTLNIKVPLSFETQGTVCPMTLRQIPGDVDLYTLYVKP